MAFQDPRHIRPRRDTTQLPPWATYLLMGLFVLTVIFLGYATFNGVKGLILESPINIVDPNISSGTGNNPSTTGGVVETGGSQQWASGRVSILLMGIDQRRSEEGPWRTDTMIYITVDPATKRAGVLSIPRDLWVEIPDYGVYDKINTAHFRGDADQYPGGGGPALAMKTVRQILGVPVDYYMSVNFYAFMQVIDRLQCVPITVEETIDDPTYPAMEGNGYDPFYLEAGQHCMDSQTLLKYARTRSTFGGDFDRAKRQQEVMYAIRDRVLSADQLPVLIAQSPDIYNTVKDGVRTDLSLDQLIQLANLASDIPRENICAKVIDGEHIESLQTLPDNSQVLIPNLAKIQQLVLDVYNGTGMCTPGGEDLQGAAASEGARVSIVNGTQREGWASESGDMLGALGINVISLGNADRFDYEQTLIYNYSSKDNTARYIAQLLGLSESAILAVSDSTVQYDILVILGTDSLK